MHKETTVRLETRQIPTYVPGPDHSLPYLEMLQREELYPYTSQGDISTESRPVPHRIVVMENEYLRAEILPDLGGRLYRLLDKSAGKDVFEFQATIKPQHVANRGAWISGGIEFNYGFHGHTVNTFAPVTWAMRQDADGGASVWVGALIMPIESRWCVRLRLRPGRAALDNEIHVVSPQALPALMYWWSNAGVEVSEKSEFFYFGPAGTGGGDRHSWPFAEGVDLRWWKNRVNQADMFLLQCQRNAMGFYDHGRQHGVACSGDRFDAPGEKYFTWGTAPHGRAFDLLLSDAGHTYCEVQRGRNESQGDSDSITSMTEDIWSESWIPLRNTQGFSDNCRELVLHVVQGEEQATVNLQGLEVLTNLFMEVQSQDKSLGRFAIARIAPDALASEVIKLPPGARVDRIRICDARGKLLLDWKEYAPNPEDWTKPGRYEPLEGLETADKIFAQAHSLRFLVWPRRYEPAVKLYEQVLRLDPGHAGALQAMVEMDFFNGRFADALAKAQSALTRAMNHPDLLALKGWSLLRLGKLSEAIEAFGWSGRTEPARRKGLFGLAMVQLRQGDFAAADNAAQRILAANPIDKWGRLLRVMVLRKTGETAEAQRILKELLAIDPLWNTLHAEALLLSVGVDLADGARTIGDDSVSAAGIYMDLAWWEDAAAILEVPECNEAFSSADRLAHLLLTQLKLGRTQAAAQTLQALRSAPERHAHSWTTQSIGVLEQLARTYPAEAMIQLLLGNVLASRHRKAEALAAWRQAENLGLVSPVLLANLGRMASIANDAAAARNYYAKAHAIASADLGIWLEYDRLLGTQGLREDRLALFDKLPQALQVRTQPVLRRVVQLLDVERYQDALDTLGARELFRGENDGSMRYLYIEALAGLALAQVDQKNYTQADKLLQRALEYPANQHMGRVTAWPNEAMVHYLLGLVMDLAGKAESAQRHWETAASEPTSAPDLAASYVMLANVALGRLPNARMMGRDMESYLHGDKPLPLQYFYFHGSTRLDVQSGLLMLARGQVETARRIWQKGLSEAPDTRLLRLHLRFSQPLLQRMAASER